MKKALFIISVLLFSFSGLKAQSYINIDYISSYIGTVEVEVRDFPSHVIAKKTTTINRLGLTPITVSLPAGNYVNCIVKVIIPQTGASSTYNVFDIPGYIVAVLHSERKISIEDAKFYYNAGGGGRPGGGGGYEDDKHY